MENIFKRFSLQGKVVIVTGGAGLYGQPICTALAEAGALVVVASRDKKKCIDFANSLAEKGYQAVGKALDLADENNIQDCVKDIVSNYGRVDVLINNAVSREGFKNLADMSKAEWEASQRINSTGMMLITKEVLHYMCIQRSGNIINIGSIQGAVGPNFPVYGDTGMTSPINYTYDKFAMVGFTKWIANYYGKFNIRANCISPGGYGPGIAEAIGENEFVHNYKKLTPLGRFADEEDIQGSVLFLASEASAYVTGHNLLVDGGWTSW